MVKVKRLPTKFYAKKIYFTNICKSNDYWQKYLLSIVIRQSNLL